MNKRKRRSIILAMTVFFTSVGHVFSENKSNEIIDIENHWAKEAIIKFIENGYIGGYPDNTFRPNNNITRAEFVKIINKFFGFTQLEDERYEDVNEDNWFYNDIKVAVYQGYIETKTKYFRPNENITREEIAGMLGNIMNTKDSKFNKIMGFKDVTKIDDRYKTSLEGLIEEKILGGYDDNTIRPKNGATRAEAISILFRINNMSDKNGGKVLIENNNYILQKHEPREGTYLGSYVIQDTVVNANMNEFERLTGKKHVSYFYYLGYKKGDLVKYDTWMKEVVERGGIPHVALEPNQGLEQVKNDEYLVELARMFGKYNSPIYLRYASEMNGNWVEYHGNPNLYIEKWRLIHDIMEKYAPNVIMVWTPYEKPIGNIVDYYPGDEYVDWVGVNAYNVVHRNNNINHPVSDDPLDMIDFVYDKFSNRKPIQISEYGATHDTISDSKDYTNHAIEKIQRLYNNIWEKYPRIKSIFYFNVNNIENAPEGRRINNYSLTENNRFLEAYKNIIKDEHFLSNIKPNAQGKKNREVFTLADDIRVIDAQKYINLNNISKILGGSITSEYNKLIYNINQKKFVFRDTKMYKETLYVNINEVAKLMGYKIENRGFSDTLILKKI